MANITKTSVSNAIPVIIAQEALGMLSSQNDIIGLVRRDYEPNIAAYGDTVKIQKRGALSVNDKVAGSNVTLQAPTDSNIQIVLNKHKEVSFIIEDVARAEARTDVMMGYASDAAVALREQVGTDLLTLFQSGTNLVGTAGTNVTAAVVRSARKLMNDNKAPAEGRHLIVSSKDEDALLGDSDVRQAYAFGENVQQDAQLRRLWGFAPHMSQLVTATGGGPVTTWNAAFHPLGIALVSRPLSTDGNGRGVNQVIVSDGNVGLRVTYSYNPNALGMQVTFDILYGVQIVRQEFLAVVRG